MNIEYKRLDLRSIDLADTAFVISYGFSLSILKESIEKMGVLNPPLVKKGISEQYRVVCGYKRLMSCKDLGKEELTCAVIDHNIEDRDTFLISLYDNLSHRELNPIEKSIVLGKLKEYYPDRIIVKDFLPLLGLNPHHSVLLRLNPLSGLYKEMRDAILEGRLDEGAAIKLLNFSGKDRLSLFRLLYPLRFSKNKQNEIVDNVYDIIMRDECSVSDILESNDLKLILDDKNLNTPQKGGEVRRFLRRLRYPRIVKAERDFQEMRRELNLGDSIKLTPPPSFEGNRYTIDFQFGTINELEKILKRVDAVRYNKRFVRAMEV